MLKVGIVGVGQFGQNHARILSQSDRCEFVGLYDKNQKRAVEIGEKLNEKAFADFDSLLAEIDVLYNVVTTVSHFELAKKALEKGIHVFIEKPITAEIWQAEELVELASENNLKIQVGHIERFNPVVTEIAEKVKNPIFIECHRIAPFTARGTDVPVVLELMIHDIDLILAFIKSKIKSINASGASVMTKKIDIANARIEFENGAVANITSSRISLKRSRQFRFFQKDAYFSLDFQNQKVRFVKKSKNIYKVMPKILMGKYDGIETKDVVDVLELENFKREKDALTTELEAFIEAIEKDEMPIVDGVAGMRALDVALKIVEKIKR
ncbi:MAG: Gfo/Idh/MocA family oxidoreductase [Candidatus Cloacimonetes bacterium]|jgi:predicted dehydrogenase|nr:Gfo/Idh/MocA family oxidoreductase [Candidatus Cloacimonadota bacterium]MBT6993798.1 Gfo/Idh/MocA family oxidoreductase [Candidatus Cloacimonadota bacterium]MBT7469832.1 Gfo/Idh/MocA family oxidoreductase [Candidatus Cloacimonadota bacterium]